MSGIFAKLKGLFRRAGSEPVATPAAGARGDEDRETSTNAQVEGAVGQPWDED